MTHTDTMKVQELRTRLRKVKADAKVLRMQHEARHQMMSTALVEANLKTSELVNQVQVLQGGQAMLKKIADAFIGSDKAMVWLLEHIEICKTMGPCMTCLKLTRVAWSASGAARERANPFMEKEPAA